MNLGYCNSPVLEYGMDAYGWPIDYPYGDPYFGYPSPNGWTVCGIQDGAYCPHALGTYKEDGSYYCCCYLDSGGQLPYCQDKKHTRHRRPPHQKLNMK